MPSVAHVRTFSKQGRLKEAIHILLNTYSPAANNSTNLLLLQSYVARNALSEGKLIHSLVTNREFTFSKGTLFQNRLINMYVKCERLVDARKIFDRMTERDTMSWNVIIAAYRKHGLPQEALALFHQMQKTGVAPDQFIFASTLPACAKMGALQQGMDIHERIIKSGFLSDVVIGNALIDMYAKCGRIREARKLFDKFPKRDVVSWNAMIAGYAQNGVLVEALRLFNEMPQADVVSWNAIIAGYVQNGFSEKALEMFKQMQLAQVQPDQGTFASILPACARMGALEQGMEIHYTISRSELSRNVLIGNALIDMYAKCGNIQKARELFDKMQNKDVLSWTVMIAGYTQNGFDVEALEIFDQMQLAGVKPDFKTFTSVLPACANLAALQRGMVIHEQIVRSGVESESVVMNALIDMYAKCGSLYKARELFDRMHKPTVVSWTAMIAGYAMHGYCRDALKLFEEMKQSGTSPNHITLVCVLSACCHAGFLEDANRYFTSISECYHITPTMEHYSCMVDILGRAGKLDEAHNFIKKMAIKPNANVWSCLLSACRVHNNTALGQEVALHLFELDPENPAPYVLLSNIYAAGGRWGELEKLRKIMNDRGVKKTPGCSRIEVNKQVHSFLAGDKSNSEMQNI